MAETETENWTKVLEQTASNLKQQSQLLRQQSADLAKEAASIRAAVRNARQRRNAKPKSKKNR